MSEPHDRIPLSGQIILSFPVILKGKLVIVKSPAIELNDQFLVLPQTIDLLAAKHGIDKWDLDFVFSAQQQEFTLKEGADPGRLGVPEVNQISKLKRSLAMGAQLSGVIKVRLIEKLFPASFDECPS